MATEKVWRWWEEAPKSSLLKQAAAQEYLLLLAEYAKEFWEIGATHPPVGFVFKPDGGVAVVPDLEVLPPPMWTAAMSMLSNGEKAEFYAVICEATIAVMKSESEVRQAVDENMPVKDMAGAREGVLVTLRVPSDMSAPQMLFMPKIEDGKLGEVEVPAQDPMAN
jgi:hypothetical protein